MPGADDCVPLPSGGERERELGDYDINRITLRYLAIKREICACH